MRILTLILLLALAGCRDTLSGPEAKRLADALADPWADTSRVHLEDLWSRLGSRPFRPDSTNPTASLILTIDDGSYPARAFVLETAVVHPGPLPESCQGDRYTLIAWTLSMPNRGLTVFGGDFSQPVGPPGSCASEALASTRPGVTLRPLSGPEGRIWVGTAGEASIRPLEIAEGCPFVSHDGVTWLQSQGIFCQAGTFAVEASASLKEGPPAAGQGGGHRLEVPPTIVPGVRWILDCTRQPSYVALCGHRDSVRSGA